MNPILLRGSLVVAVVASFAVPAVAQEGGPPFQVNTFAVNTQNSPAVSTDAAGRFVVAWQSQLQDGSDYGIIARGFEANGAVRTGEVQANALTTIGRQFQPAIAVVPDGGYFVAWTDGFTAQEVWLRRFTADGIPLLAEQQVNISLFVFGDQRSPSLDADGGGNIVVVWESQNGFGSPNWTINARRYNAAGVPLSGELQISQTTSGDQHKPVVAVDPQGNFVVTWEAFGADGNGNAVLARLFNSAGSPLGDQFLVNQTVAGNQERPWVDRDSLGRFVVAWQSGICPTGEPCDVFFRRFAAAGNPLSNELRANTQTFWLQERPSVATAPDGRFVVVWQSGSQDGPSWGTFGQRYDANGAAVGPEFRVNTATVGHQYQPAVTMQPSGGFVVTWAQQPDPLSALLDVWARVYPPFGGTSDLIFADGFETGS